MYAHTREALRRIRKVLEERIPGRIVSVIAFGSRVRGDHTDESDFDVLVVVRERDTSTEKAIVDVFVDEEQRSGLAFDPVIKDATSFSLEQRHHSPFYENLMREGIQI